jgi:excisionase family DNA binding protein
MDLTAVVKDAVREALEEHRDAALTAAEAAAYLRVGVSTVHRAAAMGVLPSLMVGRHRRFSRRALDDALAGTFTTRESES